MISLHEPNKTGAETTDTNIMHPILLYIRNSIDATWKQTTIGDICNFQEIISYILIMCAG